MAGQVRQPGDVIELLAWLDFCVKHRLPFDLSIEKHLLNAREASGRTGDPLTKKQAQQKLVDLSRKDQQTSAAPIPGLKDILSEGSACMHNLKDGTREKVRRKLLEYEQSTSVKHFISEISSMQTTQNKTAMESNAMNTRDSVVPAPTTKNPMAPTQKVPSSIIEALQPTQTTTLISPSSKKKAGCDLSSLPADSSLAPKQADNIHKKWQKETYDLMQQQSKSTQVILELRAQLKHREMAEKECQGAGRNPLEGKFSDLYQHIWNLEQRVKDMRKLTAFCQKTKAQSTVTMRQRMDEFSNNVESELENILNGQKPHPRFQKNPRFRQDSDLGFLVRSIFGHSGGDEFAQLKLSLSKFGSEPEVIVRVFASAAVREWVFMSSFPAFTTENCRLLESYRKVVLTYDGWESAHNLEVAAYQSIMDEPSYKAIELPRMASELAARFTRALVPLFTTADDHHQSSSWGQPPVVVENRNDRLKGIFMAALNLKSHSVMTENTFEYVVYTPHNVQESDPTDPITSKENTPGDKPLRKDPVLMLYSSMHMYRTASWVETNSASVVAMNLKNFVVSDLEDKRLDCVHTVKIRLVMDESKFSRKDGDNRIYPVNGEMSGQALAKGHTSKNDLDATCNTSEHLKLAVKRSISRTMGEPQKKSKVPPVLILYSSTSDIQQRGASGKQQPRTSTEYNGDEDLQQSNRSNQRDQSCRSPSPTESSADLKPKRRPKQTQTDLPCGNCGRIFKDSAGLKRHQRDTPCEQCSTCGLWLADHKLFLSHQSAEHSKDVSKEIIDLIDDSSKSVSNRDETYTRTKGKNPKEKADASTMTSGSVPMETNEGKSSRRRLEGIRTQNADDANVAAKPNSLPPKKKRKVSRVDGSSEDGSYAPDHE